MRQKPIGLTIIWWGEIILSARVLLFCIPVLIHKRIENNFYPYRTDDWFILILTITALLYFVLGIASIVGHRFWRIFHYWALAIVILLSAGLWYQARTHIGGFTWIYASPALFSLGISVFIALIRDKSEDVNSLLTR